MSYSHIPALTSTLKARYVLLLDKQLILQTSESTLPFYDQYGETALLYGATNGLPVLVEALLAHPDINVNLPDRVSA